MLYVFVIESRKISQFHILTLTLHEKIGRMKTGFLVTHEHVVTYFKKMLICGQVNKIHH